MKWCEPWLSKALHYRVASGIVSFLLLYSFVQWTWASGQSTLSFPKDHGRHENFAGEWWYLTGNLEEEGKAEWGFQLTIFRKSLAHTSGNQGIDHNIGDLYAGHLVVTSISTRKYVFFQTLGSSVLGSAGAANDRLHVWINTWKLEQIGSRIHVHAEHSGFGIQLDLTAKKPPALHGADSGILKKSDRGTQSYYYSMTSLNATGRILWRKKSHSVHGRAWLDREFGTDFLDESIRGWDWFGLALDNDYEVMLYVLRDHHNQPTPFSCGTIVFPDGKTKNLRYGDFVISSLKSWRSPMTFANYPTSWRVEIPRIKLHLLVNAPVQDHELRTQETTRIDYWEGPVRLSGKMSDRTVGGRGYVEMTGYAHSIGGRF